MKNQLFNRFVPKEILFFPLLTELAEVTDDAAKLLTVCISTNNWEQSSKIYSEITMKEKAADAISLQIFNKLNTTFITPFDREDIHDLTNCIESVTDAINSVAKKILLYRPRHVPLEIIELSKLVGKATGLICSTVPLLESLHRNSAHINRTCEKLHKIENQSDGAYERYITSLFDKEEDIRELVKLKEISGKLESTTDITNRVGKSLRTIIVKHS
jgi:predicted phosphate transport protein (TIGR00153 family)